MLRLCASMRSDSSRYRFLMLYEKSSRMHSVLRKLSTPEKIQKYLDDLPYNKEKDGETCRSPRLVIEYNTAHCFEAVSYTHLRAHETPEHLVCRLLLEKK